MDGIPSGTYVEKGMLKDISCILDKIEERTAFLTISVTAMCRRMEASM